MSRLARVVDHFRVVRFNIGKHTTFYVFDIVAECLVREIADYTDGNKFTSLDSKSVEKVVYHLVRIFEFLRLKSRNLGHLSDALIKEYRDWELQKTTS